MAALGDPCCSVSIIPGDGFEGCVRSAPASPSDLQKETGEILSICERLKQLTPKLGSARSASAEYYVFIQSSMIALLAGQCAEALLHPDLPPLGTDHDDVEAHAFARVAVAASPSTAALIEYAVVEATSLLEQNIDIVHLLVEALIAKGILFTGEIDQIISEGVAARQHQHRAEWKRRQASAAEFTRGLET
jgi:hypothetical protein